MKLDKFTDKYNINSMGISVKIKDGKKHLQPSSHYNGKRANNLWIKDTYEPRLFNDCSSFEEQLAKLKILRKHFDYRGMDTRTIHHIDIDIHDNEIQDIPAEWWDFIEDMKTNTSYYKSTTKKKGLHILFTTDFTPTQNSYQTIYKLDGKKSMIEVLTGTWGWCPADTEIVDNEIIELDEDELKEFMVIPTTADKHAKDTSKKVKNSKPRIPLDLTALTPKQNEYFELGEILKLKYIDEYETWIKLVWALSNDKEHNNYAIAKHISQRSEKYEECAFNTLWDNSRNGNTIGTFYYYAKESDLASYNRIRAKYYSDFTRLCDDDTLARFYMESNLPNHLFTRKNGKLHSYHNGKWKEEGTDHGLIKLMIPQQVYDFATDLMVAIGEQIAKVANPQNEWDKTEHKRLCENQKQVNRLLAQIHSCSKINSVEQRCRHYLSATENDTEFDAKGELIAFKNCVWDLSIGRIVETKREDFILYNTGYDYTEPPDADIVELNNILDTILPEQEVKNTYLHFLATGLCGFNPEKFVVANGGGRNGKGVINELFETTLGNQYFYVAPSQILLNTQKLGGCPEIANMDKKRMVIYREPDPSKKINTALVKELTGGKAISARMNYSNDMEVELKATQLCECNEKCKLSGRVGEAERQRFVDIPFTQTFTDNLDDLEAGAECGFYPKNPFYKTKAFREKYKLPLFKILLGYMDWYRGETGKNVWEKIPIPKCIDDRTKEYLDKCDELKVWLGEEITTTPWRTKEEMFRDKDYLTPKDIHKHFKRSETYANMSKDERRNANESYFRDYLNNSNPYRKKFEDRYKGKRSVLFGYCIAEYAEEANMDI
jgi:phage/plasmid-associated DNA primase